MPTADNLNTGNITRCHGGGCPMKTHCGRYSPGPHDYSQPYFSSPPFVVIEGKPGCTMYWGESADLLFTQVKEILTGKNKEIKKADGKDQSAE